MSDNDSPAFAADDDTARMPVIGISGRRMPADQPFALLGAVAIQESYPDAVTRAGGLAAVMIPCELDETSADRIVASLDGLVLTGGPDVDPRAYGEAPHETVYGVSELQDHFEQALLEATIRAGKPVLCICRGLQLLNVVYGGTLHQHLGDLDGLGAHGVPGGGGSAANDITIDDESLLARVTGTTTARGECHHHQAVDRVGDGLRVVARTADGVVEGLELDEPGQWLVAVQWHPEDSAADDPVQQRLFQHLVDAAAR